MKEVLKKNDERMQRRIDHLVDEYKSIRAGRANPAVLDKITVDYYGVPTPINQLSSISVTEARTLVIQPYDASSLRSIEKAIQMSDVGINPSTDGKVIRLPFPELTEEKRKDTSKEVKQKGEGTKVAIRNVRRDGMDQLKKLKKDATITEDEQKDLETELQKLTDDYIAKVDKRVDQKTKEVMSV